MAQRIAINGLGRIGRASLKLLLEREDVEIVAVNDLAPTTTIAHLIKYDSIHGRYSNMVSCDDENLYFVDRAVPYYSERNPEDLPWGELEVDLVIECTGVFRKREDAARHLAAGAKKVLLSAPPGTPDVKTVVIGINDDIISGDEDIISNASCTTNCVAPMVKVIDDLAGIENGFISTIHAYTADQRLHDSPHSDLRRARAAAQNIVPTSTGAAGAIGRIFPHLQGKLGGVGIRVPVPDGSLTDFAVTVKRDVTVEEIKDAFLKAAIGPLRGVLQYVSEPIVSIDIVGNPHSCIYDSALTSVTGRLVKLVGWYDNEMGYSNRLVEMAVKL
jgi:glyceraldehyde 3-phosphate dehydrogenase